MFRQFIYNLRLYLFVICASCTALIYGSNIEEVVIRGIIDKGVGANLIQKLAKATEQDTVYLYIKSCGGSVKEGLKIIQAMQATQAKTIVEIVDYVESLAAIIALFADQVYIRPDAIVMYHLPRTNSGKIAFLNSNKKYHSEMAKTVIGWMSSKKNVLSHQQWERFMQGEDVFITGDTFISRVKSAQKSLPITGERYEPWRVIKCNPDYRYRSEE